MRRDLIKTVAGVVLVGLVVVATYLYGNHQTQVQKQKTQALQEQRRQQQAATTQNAQKPASKPVNTTTSPSTQSPATQKPAAIAAQPPASAMPQTGAQTPLPQTGGVMTVFPLLLMIAAARLYWYSRRWPQAEEPQTNI